MSSSIFGAEQRISEPLSALAVLTGRHREKNTRDPILVKSQRVNEINESTIWRIVYIIRARYSTVNNGTYMSLYMYSGFQAGVDTPEIIPLLLLLLLLPYGRINSRMTSYLKIFATGRTNLKIFPSGVFTAKVGTTADRN